MQLFQPPPLPPPQEITITEALLESLEILAGEQFDSVLEATQRADVLHV